MSIEALIGRKATQILEAQSYMRENVKRAKEQGLTTSPVHIVATTFIDEGRKELRKISEKLNSSGIRVNPASTISIFRQIPPSERKKASLAYGAVVFGVTIISIEKLTNDGIFSPADMARLFNYSMDGTFIPRWNANGLKDVEVSKSNRRFLSNLAHNDPTLSVILTKGINFIPEELKKIIDNIGFMSVATKLFIPSYGDLVRKQIRETGWLGRRA